MKTVKNYNNFSEEYRLNENLLKKAWGAIVSFFKDKYKKTAWLYYALYLKKTGQLDKKQVEIIIPSNYDMDEIPTENEVELSMESFKDEKFGFVEINEEIINLDHPDPNMRNVDVNELASKIMVAYKMNARRVEQGKKRTKNHAVYIWGAPGIGKTEILNQVAEKLGIVVMEWHLSQIEPTDFRGVPKVENIMGTNNPKDERTVSKLPETFPTDDGPNGRGGIMFFDEINRAPKMVLSASLSLCLGGKIGTYELPPHWIVVAAGNRPEDLGGAVATEIEPALANRFGHVNYSPKLDSWTEWAIKKDDINPDLIAFLQWNKSYFHKLDSDKSTPNWPSPRSWEMASQEDYFERDEDWKNKLSMSRVLDIYTDLVGKEAAIAFTEYLKLKEYFNEKDVQDVYTKGAKAKKPPKRLDQQRAAFASISFWKKGEDLTVKELTNVLDYALAMDDIEGRSAMLAYFRWVHPECREKDPWRPIYWEYVKKWHKDLKGLED